MTEMTADWFVTHQARAWSEIREWAQEAEAHPLIPTQPGGSWDGPGASLNNTGDLRDWLPNMLRSLNVTRMLDAACGDWNWMQYVDLSGVAYTGWDVDQGRVERCVERAQGRPNVTFECVNLLTVPEIPRYDLILCRDCLGHFTNGYIDQVLKQFTASGSTWLLASTYPEAGNEFEYDPRRWAWLGYLERPVNLEAPPWEMSKAMALPEPEGPGGVLTEVHELALFKLNDGEFYDPF